VIQRRRVPTPLRQSLERLMADMGAPEIDATTEIIKAWPELMGPELATRVQAVAVKGSVLLVRVEDPAWASQITWLEAQLLERIEGLVGPGKITKVQVRVRPNEYR